MDVVVVGAGIVGTCVAHALARDGASVTLVDAGTPGGGASEASYAWLNSNGFDEPAYHALRVRGVSAYAELARELGTDDWLHLTGSFRVAYSGADAAAVRDRVARKQAAGYPAELLDANAAAQVNPALARLADRPAAVAYFPSEGYIDTTTLIGHLLRPFPERTLPLLRTRVLSLVRDTTGTLTGVRTSTEGDVAADRVILCAGADTSLLRDAGFPLAARGPVGATVITAPVPVRITGLIHFPDVTVRPDGAGRLLLHADDIDARIDTGAGDTGGGALSLAEDAVAELVARARTWLAIPSDDIAAAEVLISYRPYPPDGFPAVGPVPGLPGAFAVVAHSGVTLGAILGRLVAREVLHATADPLLAPYRLDRFREPTKSNFPQRQRRLPGAPCL